MDIVIQILFLAIAALMIGAAVMVVTVRNLIHAALWLITSFMGVAMLYLLLEAEFLAVVQVLIYVGAISVLVLFAIMLTRHVTGEDTESLYTRWGLALVVALLLFGAVLVPTLVSQPWNSAAAAGAPLTGAADLGRAFMGAYFLPFQLAAVLLLVALVGAIVVAYEGRRSRVPTLAETWQQRRAQQPVVPDQRDQEPPTESSEMP